MELAYEHMNNPVNLKTQSDQIAAEKVTQLVYHPASNEKIPLLIGLMRKLTPERSIVFVNTCLLYTSPSPRDKRQSRMPSSA